MLFSTFMINSWKLICLRGFACSPFHGAIIQKLQTCHVKKFTAYIRTEINSFISWKSLLYIPNKLSSRDESLPWLVALAFWSSVPCRAAVELHWWSKWLIHSPTPHQTGCLKTVWNVPSRIQLHASVIRKTPKEIVWEPAIRAWQRMGAR